MKLIQEGSRRSYNKYIVLRIAAAASHTSAFCRVPLQQDCYSTQDTL